MPAETPLAASLSLGFPTVSCAAGANWLIKAPRTGQQRSTGQRTPNYGCATTTASQPVSSRARGRQTLCLVPLRPEQEATVLRRLAYRHRDRAADGHGGAERTCSALRLQGHGRSALLRRLASVTLIWRVRQISVVVRAKPFLLRRL